MKVLTLSIKQKYFDAVLTGEKTQEFREIRPNNGRRYFRYVYEGKEFENVDDIPEDVEAGAIGLEPVKYDAIKFLTGAYNGKRPWLLVAVNDAHIELFVDENDEYITYKTANGDEYIASQVVYDLGEVLDKDLEPK